MSATDTGAPTYEDITGPISEDQAAEEFLKRFMPNDADKDQPSDDEEKTQDKPAKEDDDHSDDEQPDESADEQPDEDESSDDEDQEDDEKKRKYADEGVFVKIKVGDEEHSVPVKDLQRLYGQEAALTKKSMEVSQQRKAAEDELTKATTATAALLERAKARLQPYAQIDFLMASRELPAEQYAALRDQAAAAYEDVQFLEQHLDRMVNDAKKKQNDALVSAARESLKVLSGPAEQGGIEGWSEKLYDDIRAYAISAGAPAEVVNTAVEPWAIRIMHDAMLYQRGKSKVITKKVNKAPKKIVKTTSNAAVNKSGPNADKASKALSRLQKTGSADDAAEAFLARWEKQSDDE